MIYFLYGTDKTKALAKAKTILATQKTKNPDAESFKIDVEHWDLGRLEELIGSQGLFQGKFITVLDGLFGDKEIREVMVPKIVDLAESPNVFIVLESSLTKDIRTKIEKKAEKTQVFEAVEKEKKPEFKVFSLTDALGARDKKKLWVLYQKALHEGVEPEQIHGILFWQIKAMLSATNSKNAQDAGLNPFVYKKSLSFAKNFSEEDLKKMASDLVTLYHEARRGKVDFATALERFVLDV